MGSDANALASLFAGQWHMKDLRAKLRPTIEAVMATPVVNGRLQPFVDDLRRKLNALGTA
jgi:hypothetical protein